MNSEQPPIPGISEALHLADIEEKRKIGQEALFSDLVADKISQEEA